MNNFILFLVSTLLFILPIPNTIAVRNISILLILLTLIYIFIKFEIYKKYKIADELKKIIILLGILTIWIYFVAFFISDETSWTLREIKSQWLAPLVYFITFAMLGVYATLEKENFLKNVYSFIFLMLFVHVLYVDLYGLHYYVENQVFKLKIMGLTEGADKSNYLTNILLSFIMAEIIYRFRTQKYFLNVNNFSLLIVFILIVLSSIFEGMRNGAIAIVFLGVTSAVFSLYGNNHFSKKIKIMIALVMIVGVTIPTVYNIKNDAKWTTLIQTIPIAMDTKNNRTWIDRDVPYPNFSDGTLVGGSNYLRIAWFYEGSKIIMEHPMGVGYGRNAFGHAIQKKYDLEKQIGHSHSGLIDLSIGIGVIGVLLWLAFGIYLLYLSSRYFFLYHSYFAIIVFFNVSGFFSRFVVDSNMRDHMFQTFFAILGLSIIFMLKEKKEYENNLLSESK